MRSAEAVEAVVGRKRRQVLCYKREERSTSSILWADNLESVMSCVLRPGKVNFEGRRTQDGPKGRLIILGLNIAIQGNDELVVDSLSGGS